MIFFDDNEGQLWTTLFGIRKKCCLCCLCCSDCFDDNFGQPWTTLFGNRNVVFVVYVVVTFFDDNFGQPWITFLE